MSTLDVECTCKDRWRQVLAEAKKINHKHLLTLEAAISQHQTDQMKDEKLQLVLPKSLHRTYATSQQDWLLDVMGFIDIVREKQARVDAA